MRYIFWILIFYSSVCVATDDGPLSVSYTITPPHCLNKILGEIRLTVKGGVKPYTYLWSTGSNSSTASNLTNGIYKVEVKDKKGDTYNQEFYLMDGSSLKFESEIASLVEPTCNGTSNGSIKINTAESYDYLWSNGNTSNTINDIGGGDYTVLVSDNNCIVNMAYSLIAPPILEAAVESISHTTCANREDGQIFLHVCGGTEPYSYTWEKEGAVFKNTNSNYLLNLTNGTYKVTITDNLGCSITVPNIDIKNVDEIEIIVTQKTNLSEYGKGDGSISISVSGGTPPYSYIWNNGEIGVVSITNLFEGCYDVKVTDANGCSKTLEDICIEEHDITRSISFENKVIETCFSESIAIEGAQIKNITQFEWTCVEGGTFDNKEGLQPIFHPTEGMEEIHIVLCGHDYMDPLNEYSDTLTLKLSQNIDIEFSDINFIEDKKTAQFTYEVIGVATDYTVECFPESIVDDHTGNQITTKEVTSIQDITLLVTDNDSGCQVEGSVKITPLIENKADISPVNWITSNGDGYNDLFTIEGIASYPDNKVGIYNRWGDLVIEYQNYNNSSVAWDGTNKNGKKVVNGTYFFVINIETYNPTSGWIQVISNR